MTEKIIWIVDDDPIYQIIVNKIIKRAVCHSAVDSFKNGKEAIDALQDTIHKNNNTPDIILLDINMPIMDGWEFMEELNQIEVLATKKIKIYIVSSSIAIEDKNKSKNYNSILGYLSKPITIDDITYITSTN